MISEATRVLSVWKAIAMMSHISLECSRRSSGKPFAGRSIFTNGVPVSLALSSAASLPGRSAVHTLLHLAHAGQIIVELDLVRGTHLPAHRFRAVFHAIDDAHISQAAAILKEIVERQRRVQFHRKRRVRALPGNVRTVRHRVVRFVIPGHRRIARQHDARLRRVLSDVLAII